MDHTPHMLVSGSAVCPVCGRRVECYATPLTAPQIIGRHYLGDEPVTASSPVCPGSDLASEEV